MKKKQLARGRKRRYIRRRQRTRFLLGGGRCVRSVATGKYLSREIPTEEPVLDEGIWKRSLPDDVFCTILARLPLSSLIRFRTVCKSWYSMIHDPNFLEACSRVRSREPSLVFQNEEVCSIYEPGTDNWLPIPASFFQPKNEPHCKLVDSKRGRVLLLQRYRLMVFNPVNQSRTILPPMLDMDESDLPSFCDVHIIGMYVDDLAKFFNVLVMDKKTNVVVLDEDDNEMDDSFDDLEPFLTQVYDSTSNSWQMRGSFNPEYEASVQNASLFNGTIHCLTKAAEPHVDYHQLAIFSVLADIWDEEAIDMPEPDLQLVAPHLFTYGEKQLLAAAMPAREWPRGRGQYPVWENVIIWELKKIEPAGELGEISVHKWVKMFEIDSKEVQAELCDIQVRDFMFLPEGDVVYFGSKIGSTLGMINLKSQTWRLLPTFPEYTPYDGRDLENLSFTSFLFEPRFELVV